MGKEAESVQHYEELLQLNSVNLDTYKKLIEAKGVTLPKDGQPPLSEAYQNILKGILDEYVAAFPRTNAAMRIGLRYLQGQNFSDYLEQYMRPLIIKGVPSTLMDMREFYNNTDKVARIESFLTTSLESMEQESTLRPGDDQEQDPTVLLWLYYYNAQHNLFQNKLAEALTFVNKAIEHTPTLLELYTLKGKIYQKGGDR